MNSDIISLLSVAAATVGTIAVVLTKGELIIKHLKAIASKLFSRKLLTSYDGIRATIENPIKGRTYNRDIACSGTAHGVPNSVKLVLVVEINRLYWPRDGYIYVKGDGAWSKNLFHDSRSEGEVFSVATWALESDSKADKQIKQWLKKCALADDYPGFTHMYDAHRIARVDNLNFTMKTD